MSSALNLKFWAFKKALKIKQTFGNIKLSLKRLFPGNEHDDVDLLYQKNDLFSIPDHVQEVKEITEEEHSEEQCEFNYTKLSHVQILVESRR